MRGEGGKTLPNKDNFVQKNSNSKPMNKNEEVLTTPNNHFLFGELFVYRVVVGNKLSCGRDISNSMS